MSLQREVQARKVIRVSICLGLVLGLAGYGWSRWEESRPDRLMLQAIEGVQGEYWSGGYLVTPDGSEVPVIVYSDRSQEDAVWVMKHVIDSSRLVLETRGEEEFEDCFGGSLVVFDTSRAALNEPVFNEIYEIHGGQLEEGKLFYGLTRLRGYRATVFVAREPGEDDTQPDGLEKWGRERTVSHEMAHYWDRACTRPLLVLIGGISPEKAEVYAEWISGQYVSRLEERPRGPVRLAMGTDGGD